MRWKLLIWAFAVAAVLSIPVCATYYFEALGESGTLGIADAIMIPISGAYLTASFVAPVVAIITFLGTYRLNPQMDFLTWQNDKPIRSTLATLIFGIIALLAVFSSLQPIVQNMPLYEYYWLPMNIAWLMWALSMRSAFIDKLAAKQEIGGSEPST
jgi:hypothetical protein